MRLCTRRSRSFCYVFVVVVFIDLKKSLSLDTKQISTERKNGRKPGLVSQRQGKCDRSSSPSKVEPILINVIYRVVFSLCARGGGGSTGSSCHQTWRVILHLPTSLNFLKRSTPRLQKDCPF